MSGPRPWLKKAREDKDLTQDDLAKIMGVNRAVISDWESGRTTFRHNRAPDLCKALDVTIQYLYTGDFGEAENDELRLLQLERILREIQIATNRHNHFVNRKYGEIFELLTGNAPPSGVLREEVAVQP